MDYGMRFEMEHKNAMDFGPYGLGMTVNPMQDQLQGTNLGINWGVRQLEIGFMGARWGQGAPLGALGKPAREELIRLAELNKVSLTVHAPIRDMSGFNGRIFDEAARLEAEHDFKEALKFADQIGRMSGVKYVPVTFHCADGTPGNPDPDHTIYVADKETGQVFPLTSREGLIFSEDVLKSVNFPMMLLKDKRYAEKVGPGRYKLKPLGMLEYYNREEEIAQERKLANIDYERRILESHLRSLRATLEIKKKQRKQISKSELNELKSLEDSMMTLERMRKMEEEKLKRWRNMYYENGRFRKLVLTDEIAKERVAETASDLALEAYKLPTKPVISVENVFPEMALGNPEELARAIKKAREKFVEKAVKQLKISEDKAKKAANNLIQMTFDIGHANIWKKYKIYDEATGKLRQVTDEDIKKWVDKVRRYVGHLHVTDNFGDADMHLPVGWGNAPVKDVVEELKKKGFKGRIIAEVPSAPGGAGAGWAYSLKGFGAYISPVSTWEDAASSYFFSSYPFSVGPIYPEVGVNIYGLGFSQLPYATGAPLPGEKGKFSGAPLG